MNTQPHNSNKEEDFDSNISLVSKDSEDLHLHPHTVQRIMKTLRTIPCNNFNTFSPARLGLEHRLSPCLCSVCIYTAQETFDTSCGGKVIGEDMQLKNAYEKLFNEHKMIITEVVQLRNLNKGLKQEKMQLTTSLKNSQQQLHMLLRSVDLSNQKENVTPNIDFNAELRKSKAESEQRLNFYYKKLEQYIVKVDRQESIIRDLKSQLQQAINKYEAKKHELRLKVSPGSKALHRLNKTDGFINKLAESSFIEKMENIRDDDKRCEVSKVYNHERLAFADHSSFDNLFIDFDLFDCGDVHNFSQQDDLHMKLFNTVDGFKR